MTSSLPHRLRKLCAGITPEKALGGFAMALTPLLVLMFGAIPERSAMQLDNANWQGKAENFIHDTPAIKAPRTMTGTYAYAQAFVENGAKASVAQDLQTIAAFQTFSKPHFVTAADQAAKLDCLSQAIYYEARSEPHFGQLAVAQVVLNRVAHRAYPASVCGVVFEGAERRTGCQFTFTCDGSLAIVPRGRSWERSRQTATHALLGMSDITIGRATHYHTVAISPYWSSSLLRTANIGTHIFYRFPSRREKAKLIDPA